MPPLSTWLRRNAVPLLIGALSSLLLIALVAVVVLWPDRDRDRHRDEPTLAASPQADQSAIDDCLLGTWQTMTHTEQIEVPELDTTVQVELTMPGERVEFRADGTGTIDYGELTQFSGDLVGFPYTIEVVGTVPFQYGATGKTLVIDEITDSDAVVTVSYLGGSADGAYVTESAFYQYQCGGDDLSMSAEGYSTTLERISRG